VKDVPPPVLADLYLRAGAAPGRPPSKATIWRLITDADAEVFDAMVSRWLMSCRLPPAGRPCTAPRAKTAPGRPSSRSAIWALAATSPALGPK
jgi:hypothetical protein